MANINSNRQYTHDDTKTGINDHRDALSCDGKENVALDLEM